MKALFVSTASSSFLRPPSSRPRRPSGVRRLPPPAIASASKGDNHGCGFVDEDMLVLRKRILELEIVEGGDVEDDAARAPEGWMGWEKQYYYERYNSDVCEAAATLQGLLLQTRPAAALGLAVLLAVSVSTTGILALLCAADLVKLVCLFCVS